MHILPEQLTHQYMPVHIFYYTILVVSEGVRLTSVRELESRVPTEILLPVNGFHYIILLSSFTFHAVLFPPQKNRGSSVRARAEELTTIELEWV